MGITMFTSILAIVAGLTASATADTCGNATYSASQYYCFDGDFLCPKVNGEQYLRCGDGCYSTSQYDCASGKLEPHNLTNDDTVSSCGNQPYKIADYYCYDSDTDPFLCPIGSEGTYVRCGGSCYLPTQYSCQNGQLNPTPDVSARDTCVTEYGDCEIELPTGGIEIATCCGGENFACVATKCRDLRKLGGGSSRVRRGLLRRN